MEGVGTLPIHSSSIPHIRSEGGGLYFKSTILRVSERPAASTRAK